MILTRGATRVLRRAGKTVGVVAVVGALAFGVWCGVSALRGDENGAAKAGGAPLLIYSEFGRTTDTIWAAPADNPSHRNRLATVDHAPEYGILASLSPDGKRIAYTALPTNGAAAIDAPAEVWLMDADGRNRKRLAVNADLPVAPVWSPDGAAVVVRRSDDGDSAGRFQLVRVTTSGGETTLVDSSAGLMPVGFTPGGALYYVTFSTAGTDLGIVYPAGGVMSNVAHLSDDFARDWHLSPDGTKLAYLAPRQNGDAVSYGAVVLDLSGGGAANQLRAAAASLGGQGDEFNPIWRPDGTGITIGRLTSPAAAGAPVLQIAAAGGAAVQALAAPARGFDVPLAWSQEAGYLAVRYFEGSSVTNPGRSWVTVVGAEGRRQTVSSNSDIEVMGWVDSGG
jgi:hypothetical protein